MLFREKITIIPLFFSVLAFGYCIDSKVEANTESSYKNANKPDTIVEIRSTGIELSYDVTEIHAKAGDKLMIRYINDSEMNHNVVLVNKEEAIRPVGIAAFQAIDNDYIPEDEMDRIIAYSALAYPGDTVNVSITVPSPGTYPYICTYSGHWTQMQGRLIATDKE